MPLVANVDSSEIKSRPTLFYDVRSTPYQGLARSQCCDLQTADGSYPRSIIHMRAFLARLIQC